MIVEDIATDPLWDDYRAYALPLGLRACWSQPIIDETGTVLGTFALYYPEVKAPCDPDLALVDRMTRLVRVALIQDRREKVLIETEQKLRDYLAVSSDWLWEQDVERRLTMASSNTVGIDTDALIGKVSWDNIPKNMTDEQIAAYDADMAAERPFRGLRVQQADAEGRPLCLNINGKPIYDVDGNFRGYRGTAHRYLQADRGGGGKPTLTAGG